VRTSDPTYCAYYETPVLDEIDDLFSAKEKDVKVVLKGKSLTLTTPKVSEAPGRVGGTKAMLTTRGIQVIGTCLQLSSFCCVRSLWARKIRLRFTSINASSSSLDVYRASRKGGSFEACDFCETVCQMLSF
jgi:hypothetical protein